jgi:predicted NBD/HSP70 family sugar kinase/biotin operon repressor
LKDNKFDLFVLQTYCGGFMVKDKFSLKSMKKSNTELILSIILKNQPISRANISKMTKLSRAAVSSIVQNLLKEGFISEIGVDREQTGTGRKGILLEGNHNFVTVGFDINSNLDRLICLDINGNVVEKAQFTRKNVDFIQEIRDSLKMFFSSSKLKGKNIKSVGIAFPGFVSEKENVIAITPYLKNENNFSALKELENTFGIPFRFENKAKLMTIAEKNYGYGKDSKNMLFINIAVGIGSGLFIDGKMYKGSSNLSGEIGHFKIMDEDGDECVCGSRGCLETVLSSWGLVKRYNKFSVSKKIEGQYRSDAVVERALEGDETAVKVIEEAGHYLGFVLANIANVLNLDLIVIGGSNNIRNSKIFKQKVLNDFDKYSLGIIRREIRIEFSQLGEDIAAIGAAQLGIDFCVERTLKNMI